MKKAWVMLTATALVATSLVGCSDESASKPQAGSGEVDTSYVLKVNSKTEPPSLDPPKGFDGVSYNILNNVMEGLVRLDKDHKPQPAMASKWDVSADGKTYTFTLRDSKWSNGDPVTAHDFEFAWKRISDPKNAFPSSFLANYIAGAAEFNAGKGKADDVKVKAKDDKTFEVTLKQPTGFFLNIISSPVFFPVPKKVAEQNPEWAGEAATFVSNGPFTLTEWNHGSALKAKKSEGYWDQDTVKLAGINWAMVNEENTQYQMYSTEQFDAIESVPGDMKKQLIDAGDAKTAPEASIYYYRMNTKMEPFQNKNIRKAMALAVDRASLIEHVAQGKQKPALSHVPYGFPGPDGKDFRETGGDYLKDNDAETAKALLKKGMEEEGYTTLPEIVLTYNTDDMHKSIAQAMQEMWKKNLGVEVKLENKEFKVMLAEQRARKLQMSRSTITADYGDPLNFLELFETDHPGNRVNYSNPQYDALLKKIRSTTDEKERFALMHEAEKLYMDETPLVPIYYSTKVFMEKANVSGIVRHPVGNIEYKWVEVKK